MIESAILNDKKRRLDYAIGIVIGHLIAEAINEINLALDSNKSRWITIHPNGKKHKGRACKIDLETGQIKGGNLPQHVYNKPLKEAFEKSNQSEDIHYFALQEKSLPQQGNVRFTLKPKELSPAELKAATIQGRQILKANPLPRRFKDKYEGIAYLKKLLPNTRLIIDSLPVNVIHRIATALYLIGQYFPFILVHGLDEINEYQHKVALYDSQAKQRKQVVRELLDNSQNNSKIIAQAKQTAERINNSLKGLSVNEVNDLLRDEHIGFELNDTERNLDGSLKEDAFKKLSKRLLLANFNKSKTQALESKGLIANKPQAIANNVAAIFSARTISLNGLYYGYDSSRKIYNMYNNTVKQGWTFELSSNINPHIAIFIHELAHAIDYQLGISQDKNISLDYNSSKLEMRRKQNTSYACSNIFEYVAQNITEALTAKHKSDRAKRLFQYVLTMCDYNQSEGTYG